MFAKLTEDMFLSTDDVFKKTIYIRLLSPLRIKLHEFPFLKESLLSDVYGTFHSFLPPPISPTYHVLHTLTLSINDCDILYTYELRYVLFDTII